MYKIYGKPGCIFCVRAKRLLDSLNLKYVYIDIEEDDHARYFVREVIGARKVPQCFIGDEYIGGYDDLEVSLKTDD